ncbi:hypothetical protein ABU162_14210 [Paenibacillus thiaminolyticus]|uniref:hypothetical protein n=1 Tax=Paenibacillus thiaminolyticus TaxID=49283 RepID=UPI0035A68D14
MAHVTIDTGSTTLRMTTNIHVVYPLESPHPSGSTLYLLHGAGDNASTWQRLTTIELYAATAFDFLCEDKNEGERGDTI